MNQPAGALRFMHPGQLRIPAEPGRGHCQVRKESQGRLVSSPDTDDVVDPAKKFRLKRRGRTQVGGNRCVPEGLKCFPCANSHDVRAPQSSFVFQLKRNP